MQQAAFSDVRDLAPDEWQGFRVALLEPLCAMSTSSAASLAAFKRDALTLRLRLDSAIDSFRKESALHTDAARDLAAHCTLAVACIDAESDTAIFPCGISRQRLAEFDTEFVLVVDETGYKTYKFEEILPYNFKF